jgi:hypothetical protein
MRSAARDTATVIARGMPFRKEIAPMDDWLSPEDLARAGGVAVSDVLAAVQARTLRAVTTHPGAGGRWRIHAKDGDAWLRSVDPAWPADGLRTARSSSAENGPKT